MFLNTIVQLRTSSYSIVRENMGFIDIISTIFISLVLLIPIGLLTVANLVIKSVSRDPKNDLRIAQFVVLGLSLFIIIVFLLIKTPAFEYNSETRTGSVTLWGKWFGSLGNRLLSYTLKKDRSTKHLHIIYMVVSIIGILFFASILAYLSSVNPAKYKSLIVILSVIIGIAALFIVTLGLLMAFGGEPYNPEIPEGDPLICQQYNTKESLEEKAQEMINRIY